MTIIWTIPPKTKTNQTRGLLADINNWNGGEKIKPQQKQNKTKIANTQMSKTETKDKINQIDPELIKKINTSGKQPSTHSEWIDMALENYA